MTDHILSRVRQNKKSGHDKRSSLPADSRVFRKIIHYFLSAPVKIIEALFPDSCLLCNSLITMGDKGLCSRCNSSLEHQTANDEAPPADRYIFFENHYQLFKYSRNILKLLYAFKNGGCLHLSRFFLSALRLDDMPDFDIITYVPSSAKKLKKRGFCHTEILAREISRKSGRPCRLLLKERNRVQQKREHFDGRFLNTIGLFGYIQRRLKGERVLLVDDILTTGATVNECARILKKNGAGTVLSLTISRVPVKYQKKTE